MSPATPVFARPTLACASEPHFRLQVAVEPESRKNLDIALVLQERLAVPALDPRLGHLVLGRLEAEYLKMLRKGAQVEFLRDSYLLRLFGRGVERMVEPNQGGVGTPPRYSVQPKIVLTS